MNTRITHHIPGQGYRPLPRVTDVTPKPSKWRYALLVVLVVLPFLSPILYDAYKQERYGPPPASPFKEADLEYMGRGEILHVATVPSMCLKYKPGTRDTNNEQCEGPVRAGYNYAIKLDAENGRAVVLRSNYILTVKMFGRPEVFIYRYPDGNYIFAAVRPASS